MTHATKRAFWWLRAQSLPAGDASPARDVLIGSNFESDSYAGGLSYVTDWGFIGGAISDLEASYGLPGAVEPGTNTTPVLNMQQTRADFELGIATSLAAISSMLGRVCGK